MTQTHGSDQSALRPSRRRFGRRDTLVLVGTLALVLIIVAVAAVVYRQRSAGLPAPPPVTPSTGRDAPTGPVPTVPGSRVTERDLDRSLIPDAAGYEIIGVGSSGLVRVRPDQGRVIEAPSDALVSENVSLVANRGYVIAGASESLHYLFPDGEPAQGVANDLLRAVVVLPGPDADRFWSVSQASDGAISVRLTDRTGVATETTLPVPYDGRAGGVVADGTGYLAIAGIGGWYRAGPDGLRRVTGGALLGVGPTRWLTQDCDDAGRCTVGVTDRATGQRRVLPGEATTGVYFPGLISPDGRWAALPTYNAPGFEPALELIDLTTGGHRTLGVSVGGSLSPGQVVWSPDSRWLYVLDDQGRLVGVDPRTARPTRVGGDLPTLATITVRTA